MTLKCVVCLGDHLATVHEVHRLATDAASLPTAPAAPVTRASRAKRPVSSEKVNFSKTQLVQVRCRNDPSKVLDCLAIVDEQACQTFADVKVKDQLGLKAPKVEYSLETLAGVKTHVRGYEIAGLQVKNPREEQWYDMPVAYTGSHLPDTRAERATREIVEHIPSVAHLAKHFEEEDENVESLLLIGLDMSLAFNPTSEGKFPPYAHHNIFGWSVVGSVERDLLPTHTLAYRTPSVAKAERILRGTLVSDVTYLSEEDFLPRHKVLQDGEIFEERPDDDETTFSCDDGTFIKILKNGVCRESDGKLQLPLPLRENIDYIPQDEAPVYYRNKSVLDRVKKNDIMRRRAETAMQQHLDLGHVERAPGSPMTQGQRSNPATKVKIRSPDGEIAVRHTPLVLVNQERKDSIRITLDGAASFKGMSLNDLLYAGPDLNNTLRSVMLRLRTYSVAFSMDIRLMFNCFGVPVNDRDLLRFHWWEDNDPNKALVSYRYRVHPFGARSSPGVSMFALKAIAAIGRREEVLTEEQARFIEGGFYIDDGMGSQPTAEEVIPLITAVAAFLKTFGLNLHKVNSNSQQVMEAFSQENSGQLVTIDPNPIPLALGVVWDTKLDTISVPLKLPEKPFTKRGILATVNSIFDPEGIASPVVLGGRNLMRKVLASRPVVSKNDWDEPLPEEYRQEWESWMNSIQATECITIPRCFSPINDPGVIREYHVFSDASEMAVGCVAYLRSIMPDGTVTVRLICASSKLAPKAATTIPRLELCAALLAAIMLHSLLRDVHLEVKDSFLYTDSMIVLG